MIKINEQVGRELLESEHTDLEELYTDYQQGLEEFLVENGFNCSKCQSDMKELSEVKSHLCKLNKIKYQ